MLHIYHMIHFFLWGGSPKLSILLLVVCLSFSEPIVDHKSKSLPTLGPIDCSVEDEQQLLRQVEPPQLTESTTSAGPCSSLGLSRSCASQDLGWIHTKHCYFEDCGNSWTDSSWCSHHHHSTAGKQAEPVCLFGSRQRVRQSWLTSGAQGSVVPQSWRPRWWWSVWGRW